MVLGLILALVALVAVFVALSGQGGSLGAIDLADVGTGGWIAAGALSLYLLFMLSGLGGRLGQTLRHLAVWLVLFLALIVGYAFRDEVGYVVNRVAGDLLPPGTGIAVETGVAGERAVRIRRRGDGHFIAGTSVNGASVRMLVDTGASTVVLKPADAALAGINTDRLTYSVAVSTANGTAYAAPVRLRKIGIGPLEVEDVEALVAKPGMLKESLLGMSFLRRLRSFDFSGEFLTLRG
ncbi:MAG: TIGR02281 family clan AA aspartic protease [Hyphomicrobiaceae bacterium]